MGCSGVAAIFDFLILGNACFSVRGGVIAGAEESNAIPWAPQVLGGLCDPLPL
jgi:hypothetical protein